MRWCYRLAAVCLGLASSWAWCDEFPYTAYVNSADVYVRSGPGKNYYPTEKLQQGEKVEVYRHDPGGWYAIRPPRQSCSWISARHVELGADGVGVVNSDGVVARVGSTFSDIREVIQVRLNRGEKVELLEPTATTNSQWYKIAPPSGEFRWVFGKFVDREAPRSSALAARDEQPAKGDAGSDDAETDSDDDAADAEVPEKGAVKLASGARNETTSFQEGTEENHSGDARVKQSLRERRKSTRNQRVESNPDALQAELNELDLQLSAMVAEEITAWSFIDLRLRAERALEAGQTALERGRVRVLLNKIARFEELKQRHDAVTKVHQQTDMLNQQIGSTIALRRGDIQSERFDGVGRLSPVASRKAGSPQFALMDATGGIAFLVTPAPGVNLRPYVDKHIGVTGSRGYLPELQKPHINVQRITSLDAVRR